MRLRRSSQSRGVPPPRHERLIAAVCGVYLVLALVVASASLDVDELAFALEPYELVGGDYTGHYLADRDWQAAASTIARSYYLAWKYRPLFSPLVAERDRHLFDAEAARFGYAAPMGEDAARGPVRNLAARRMFVPDPDRQYALGAGKPLLPAILSLPQMLLVGAITSGLPGLVRLQATHDYHPVFVMTRLAQILAGLATILLVWRILLRETDPRRALLGAAIVAVFPVAVLWFPNLHHDAILVPFGLLAADAFIQHRFIPSGIAFGLALASKNVAVFLAAALLAYAVYEAWSPPRDGATVARRRRLLAALRQWGAVMLVGGLVLLPFADPVSYVEEIATPVTGRAYDPRGEQVSQFTIAGKLGAPIAPGSRAAFRSRLWPEVRAVNSAFGLNQVWFFFVALAGVGLFSRPLSRLGRMSLLVLCVAIPASLTFGHDLNYRALMFVPFFACLAVEIGRTRPLVVLLGLLLVVDLVYALHPLTATTIHLPVSLESPL